MRLRALLLMTGVGVLIAGCGSGKGGSDPDDVPSEEDEADTDEEQNDGTGGRGGGSGAGGKGGTGGTGGTGGSSGSGGMGGLAGAGGQGGQAGAPGGHPFALTKVRFYPRGGSGSKMVGGKIQASNTGPTNDFVDLATIEQAPSDGMWSELTFPSKGAFRWIKYYGPKGSRATVAELEFYAGDRRLTGTPFGTAGSNDNSGNTFDKAFDTKTDTFFDSPLADDSYVGIDLGEANQVALPTATPAGGSYKDTQMVTLSSATAGATIRYTVDGATPTASVGMTYGAPIAVAKDLTITAIAIKDGLIDSPMAKISYRIGEDPVVTEGFTTYHLGNSLTDTINDWLKPIADSAGYKHNFMRYTIPGAPTDWLWGHQTGGNGTPPATAFAQKIDHLFTQPFAGHCRSVANETENGERFYNLGKPKNPNLRHWVYTQWPDTKFDDCFSKATADDLKRIGRQPAKTWEEAVSNHSAFMEEVRKSLDDRLPGPPVGVIPGGPALVKLKQEIEGGRIPGLSSFNSTAFSGDGLHLSARGAYMVSLTFFSCLYRKSPEGIVTSAGTGLTMEQAKLFQRAAWEVASTYQYCK